MCCVFLRLLNAAASHSNVALHSMLQCVRQILLMTSCCSRSQRDRRWGASARTKPNSAQLAVADAAADCKAAEPEEVNFVTIVTS